MKICSLYTANRMDVNFCKENLISGSKIAIMIAGLTDAQWNIYYKILYNDRKTIFIFHSIKNILYQIII